MRIGPLELFDDTFHGDGLCRIHIRRGVVCIRRTGDTQRNHHRTCDQHTFHALPPVFDKNLYRTLFFDWVVGMCSLRSGRHDTSAMSRSSTRLHRFVIFHSPSQLFGSVSAYSIDRVFPLSIIWTRSTMCSASLPGIPESIQ